MLRESVGVLGNIPRLQVIASVFIRHGLGDIVRRIGIVNVGEILNWGARSESMQLEPAARLRMALEELGPTFVKLGQLMATRMDLFPAEWIAELEKLHNEVPPVPFETLLPDLERTLGRSPFEVFRDLDTRAYAAASIAQVHRAKLQDGTEVVLKVRRPNIRANVEADLRILMHVAKLIESEIPESRRYRPTEVVGHFARSLERELDLAIEARSTERIAASFRNHPNVVIPKIYPEYTSEILNVQEHIEAIPGTDLAAAERAGLDRRILAARGADAILKMILIDGFFQADPHPGNVFLLPGNRIVMIDFGMVGRLSSVRRNQVIDLFAGFAQMDEEAMLDTLLDWAGDAYVDEAQLAADVNALVFDYEGVRLREIRVAKLLGQLSAIIRGHSIVMPPDLALMFKAMITMEGLGRQYDPDLHVVEHLTPILRRAIAERYRPSRLMRRGRNSLGQLFNLLSGVPRDLGRLLRDARRGRMRVELDLKRLDTFGRQIDRSLDRASMAIMTASIVIGSSIVMTVNWGPQIFGVPVLTIMGLLGYAVAFFNSLWVIIGIWRSGKA